MKRFIAAALGRLNRPTPQLDPTSDAGTAARAFDRDFYLTTYPDVAEDGVDPLDHFMTHGWREGRDPNADFSVEGYLATFPQVAASGENPLVHSLVNGRPRTVPPESPLGYRFDIIEHQEPIEQRLGFLAREQVNPGSGADLAEALKSSQDGLGGLHLTLSHDDFSTNLGGLQLAIRREAAQVAAAGRDHLHLHCARPWPLVRQASEREPLGVVWNGKPIGAFWPETIIETLGQAASAGPSGRSFAIHSLLGHAPDEVADILAAVGLRQGTFWLHDFASLCAGYHLLRNGVEDCSAPPPESAACGICHFGPWRARHALGHARLFERLLLTVAAPSAAALNLWQRSSDLPAVATEVRPLASLKPRVAAPIPASSRPFRVAYAGLPLAHKGWRAFMSLAFNFADDLRYEFLHLGATRDRSMPCPFVEVLGGPDNPQAMQEALEAAQVDAVLIWPLCQETFSFVAHEAVAAGCALITGPDSGNVAAFVTAGEHGLVLPNEAALSKAFETGEILQLARAQRRPMLYDLIYSALTLDLAKTPIS